MTPRRSTTSSHRLVGAAVAVALSCGALGVTLMPEGRDTGPASTGPARADPPAVDPRLVLGDWDRARARAWAAGDPAALSELYVPGSRTGVRDRAMLARYLRRGLRVEQLELQRLSVRVLRQDDALLVLRVRDRLVRAVAVGRDGAVLLPRGGVRDHLVTLQCVEGAWRVVEVRPPGSAQARAAASTARMSGSWKS